MSKYPEYFEWKNVLWDPLYEKKKSPVDNKDQKTRVAAYCRVSVKREDGYKSLENQVSYYTQFIKSQKNYRLAGVYFDFGISAVSSDKRNGFKRLIRHCKEERIDLILTKNVSRFSRNSKELLEVVKQLTELGITIYFERENIDTSRDYNSFIFSVQAAVAQDEIETASQLCKYGYEKKLMKGKPNFRNPYGYDVTFKDGETIVTINEAEAKVVKWIYQQFLQGKTYAEINRELIKNGIKTKKGNIRWESTVVKKILTSVVYIGNKLARSRTKDFLTGKIKKTTDREQYLITNTHPAIITEDVFNLAQERVKKAGKKSHNSNNKQRKRAFSKRIICGRCEKRYRAQYNTRWDCPNALPSVNLCKAKRLSDNELKEMSLKAFQERFNTLTELIKILQHINQNDHFEFHRLKMLTEIEILKSKGLDIVARREEYAKFEERVSKIEADRTYRDQAINWLTSLKNIDEFRDEITVELIRAWVMEIAVYSKDAFIIKWIDEKETVIGETEIEEIKKQITEQEIISTIELNHKPPIQLEQIEAALSVSSREEVKNMTVEARTEEVQNEVIKLEPGMGIAAVKNLKKSLSKAKALNILSKKDKKLKVASYCRVSTLEGQQQVSLQTQIAYYTYLILKNPQWEFAGIYADKGLSGTSTEHREEFNKMLEAAKAGKIDLIITKSISRFSRNVVDVLEIIKTLRELPNPVNCYFEKENINTADKEASMLITLMGAVAENEVVNLSKNTRWGITKLAQRGIIHKTTNIYGYHIDKDRNWEIVPEEAEVIRFIAKEYVAGSRYKNIIQKLHAKGIKSPSGKAYWNDHQIRQMLKNEKYKGDYLYQKHFTPEVIGSKIRVNNGEVAQYYIEKHHPAIIDNKQWDLVQVEMEKRSRKKPEDAKPIRTAGRKVFYQRFYCSHCGGLVSRYRSGVKTGRKGSSWRCYNSFYTLNVDCDSSNGLKEKYLEYHFMTTLWEIQKNERFTELVKQEIEKLKLTQDELMHEEEIQREMEALYQKLYDAVDGEVAKDGRDTQKIDFLTGEIIKLKNQLKSYDERKDQAEQYTKELDNLLKVSAAMEPINFPKYHHMDVRIKPGESVFNTTKKAKDETYIRENGQDYFREDLFAKYVKKGKIDSEGQITYQLIFGINYGCDMTYAEYLENFEQTKADINLEELLISKEVEMIKEFCQEAKMSKEMREYLGIESKNSFNKRVLMPLLQAGKLKLIRGKQIYDRRYYWDKG